MYKYSLAASTESLSSDTPIALSTPSASKYHSPLKEPGLLDKWLHLGLGQEDLRISYTARK